MRVASASPSTANRLRFLICRGENRFLLAIRIGADSQRLLFSFCAVLHGDAPALCPHAGKHVLLVLLRKVQPLDADVPTLRPYCCKAARSLLAVSVSSIEAALQLVLSCGNQGFQIFVAECSGQAGPDDVVQAHFRRGNIPDALHEAVRIFNAPGNVVFNDQVFLVAGEELRGRWDCRSRRRLSKRRVD